MGGNPVNSPTQLKLKGMGLAVAKHKDTLRAARLLAQFIGGQQETVSINDIRAHFGSDALQQASGSVFLNGEWDQAGFEKTTHEEGHARWVMKWRLRHFSSPQ
jgi:hypothetical protein